MSEKKMSIKIRHATEADLAQIMALLAVLYKGDIRHGLRTLVDEYLGSSTHTVLLAEDRIAAIRPRPFRRRLTPCFDLA